MSTPKILFFILFFFFSFLSFSQQNKGLTVTGQVVEKSGQTVPFATIVIEKTDLSMISDENGKFTFKNVKPGRYTIKVSAIGFSGFKKSIEVSGISINIPVQLDNELQELENVSVLGRSAVEKINKQAYNVTAVDAKKLHNSTLDLAHALDRVSGVRFREAGGVGSRS
jgi:hypothetical protein